VVWQQTGQLLASLRVVAIAKPLATGRFSQACDDNTLLGASEDGGLRSARPGDGLKNS
jgi:hypothetical protein